MKLIEIVTDNLKVKSVSMIFISFLVLLAVSIQPATAGRAAEREFELCALSGATGQNLPFGWVRCCNDGTCTKCKNGSCRFSGVSDGSTHFETPTTDDSSVIPNTGIVAPTLGGIEAATPTSADREASKPSKGSSSVIAPSNRKIPVTLGTLKPASTRTKIITPSLPKVTKLKAKKPDGIKPIRPKVIAPKSYTPIGKSTVIVPNNRVAPVQPVSSRAKVNKGTSNFDEADALFGKRTRRLK